jgi:hypothetical protein
MYTDVKQGSRICKEFRTKLNDEEFRPENPLFTTIVCRNCACVLCQVARFWHQQNIKPCMTVELHGILGSIAGKQIAINIH